MASRLSSQRVANPGPSVPQAGSCWQGFAKNTNSSGDDSINHPKKKIYIHLAPLQYTQKLFDKKERRKMTFQRQMYLYPTRCMSSCSCPLYILRTNRYTYIETGTPALRERERDNVVYWKTNRKIKNNLQWLRRFLYALPSAALSPISCNVSWSYVLYCLPNFVYRLGLCLFSGLVCDLLPAALQGGSMSLRMYLPESTLPHSARRASPVTVWTGSAWSTPVIRPGDTLPALVGCNGRKEKGIAKGRNDCWNLLARGCMPAHKHCALLLPAWVTHLTQWVRMGVCYDTRSTDWGQKLSWVCHETRGPGSSTVTSLRRVRLSRVFWFFLKRKGKTGVTADSDRMFNSSSIFDITLREELFSLPKQN